MAWLEDTLDTLSREPAIGYGPERVPSAEPMAVAALALAAHELSSAAKRAADCLAMLQQGSGAVAVRMNERGSNWPTSLAVIAWCAVNSSLYRQNIDRGVAWLLANRGKAVPQSSDYGHNSELVGWAYAEQTHSWVEPTSFAILALRAAGKPGDPAAKEAVALLLDRQLPHGGLNYGNTTVLGQFLRAHVHPTGIALLALTGAADSSGRLMLTIDWLRRNIGPRTTPLSLGWAILGLRAHDAAPSQADHWLALAAETARRSPHKLALLALGIKGWPL
jgi:hypothetical protein